MGQFMLLKTIVSGCQILDSTASVYSANFTVSRNTEGSAYHYKGQISMFILSDLVADFSTISDKELLTHKTWHGTGLHNRNAV